MKSRLKKALQNSTQMASQAREMAGQAAEWIAGLDVVPTESGEEEMRTCARQSNRGTTSSLPWDPRSEVEKSLERTLRSRMLKISTDDPSIFTSDALDGEAMPPQLAIQSAETILRIDENLRKVRFQLVPRYVDEEKFWQRYFVAVDRIRAQVLEEHGQGLAESEPSSTTNASDSAPYSPGDLSSSSPTVKFSCAGGASPLVHLRILSKDLRHLGSALETAREYRRMSDMSDAGRPSSKPSSVSSKLGGLRRAVEAGKNMLTRKLSGGLGQEGLVNAVWDIFDPDAVNWEWSDDLRDSLPSTCRVSSQIGGAAPFSFLAYLAKHMSKFTTLSDMSVLWVEALDEIRWHWAHTKPVPRVPVEESPDLTTCILHQKLMLLNCCIARKARFEQRRKLGSSQAPVNVTLKDGSTCCRRGHKELVEGLMMLENGEPVYAPEIQEPAVFTEDTMRETDEMIMKTGSIGPGLQQLHSDMQAFKAANPGCVLADFVRWYSPSDWIRNGDDACLSSRMTEPGNMWTELFTQAKAIPAAEQNPLFDMEYNGDLVMDYLSDIAPSGLFEQLFLVAVVLRHALLEAAACDIKARFPDSEVMSGVLECESFSIKTCGKGMSASKIERICTAYDTVGNFIVDSRDKHEVEQWGEEDNHQDRDEWTVL